MNREQYMEWLCDKRKCKKSSAQTHWYTMKRVRKMLDLPNEKIPRKSGWIPKNPDTLFKHSANVNRNLSATLVGYLKATGANKKLIETYTDHMNEHASEVENFYKRGEKTEKQEKNWISGKKIQKFVREVASRCNDNQVWKSRDWSSKQRRLAEDLLMLTIHANNPPRLEMASLVYRKTPDEIESGENAAVKLRRRGWHAFLSRGKTIKTNQPLMLKFTAPVSRVLNKFVKKLTSGEPFFTDKNGAQLTRNAYGKRLAQLFKARFNKPVTASLLRTIFITEKYKDTPAWAEMEHTAGQMMHSVQTALLKYKKN